MTDTAPEFTVTFDDSVSVLTFAYGDKSTVVPVDDNIANAPSHILATLVGTNTDKAMFVGGIRAMLKLMDKFPYVAASTMSRFGARCLIVRETLLASALFIKHHGLTIAKFVEACAAKVVGIRKQIAREVYFPAVCKAMTEFAVDELDVAVRKFVAGCNRPRELRPFYLLSKLHTEIARERNAVADAKLKLHEHVHPMTTRGKERVMAAATTVSQLKSAGGRL